MKKTIDLWDFREEFLQMGRGDQFSYDGLEALYDFLEENYDDYELDVIELCCMFTEYEGMEEFWEDYDEDDYPTMEDVDDNFMVIMIDKNRFLLAS